VPEPVAVIVSTVPETLAPRTMQLLVPVVTSDRAPEAVTLLATFIAAAPPAVSVKLKIAPVEGAAIVTAPESLT